MNTTRRRLFLLLFVNLLLLVGSVWVNGRLHQQTVILAVAKGKAIYDMTALADMPLDVAAAQRIARSAPQIEAAMAGNRVEFVNAVPLAAGEARHWQNEGCGRGNCAHVTFYNDSDGGTINAIVNMDDGAVVGEWEDALARPGGSEYVLPKAFAIAAADSRVTAVLGDIGDADPAMIPMSAWLADGSCRDQWCVNLTFHSPNGDGRIFHIFVNMEAENVVRTFYTRGREELAVAAPPPQRNAYTDGCRQQYGWDVCWEMTAHDGVDFRGGTFEGTAVFESIKIGQVEAWYPSWPGGYRDEIGFRASVPPYGGTAVTDLGDGFEVRQLFTEFNHWPNCICCYRYEEVLRFYADGSFETNFVSHGPGCDDLSVYRPFWRIDMTLDGRNSTETWLWEDSAWAPLEVEAELHPFVNDLSPDGDKLATFNGDTHYRWHMTRNDPLGLDEAYLFLTQFKSGDEGDGPIVTGPGDTFQPPRQWVDAEPLTDPVLWWVPLLKTKQSAPLWCSPDPEPGINQCQSSLRARPAGELRQPTAAELEAMAAIPTATPVPTAPPMPTSAPRAVAGETAEEYILNAGCGSCHKIGRLGEAHKVGPDLSQIGLTARNRIDGLTAAEYIRQSILNPNAFIARDCPNTACLANIMPQDYASRLTANQVDEIVNYLLTEMVHEVQIVGDGAISTPTSTIIPPAYEPADRNNSMVIQITLLLITFILTVFLLIKTGGKSA